MVIIRRYLHEYQNGSLLSEYQRYIIVKQQVIERR